MTWTRTRLRIVIIVLAIAALAPIWCVHYLPTSDGPSHLYNSWVLHELITGHNTPQAAWFHIDWRPHPNWSGHAILALLLFIVPPLVAEKLLASGIVLLFIYAMWLYAGCTGDDGEVYALLAMPFAYNLTMQMGFWNFCIGVALYFIVIAVWWKRRDAPTLPTIATIAGLLLALWFSHALTLLLAVGSIGVLWLVTLRGRRLLVHARHLLAFLPLVPLLAWFIRVRGTYSEPGHMSPADMFDYVRRGLILFTFTSVQSLLGSILFFVLVALLLLTIVRTHGWNERHAFAILSIVIVIVFALAPSASSGGTMLEERMALFATLVPLAWLAPRLGPRAATLFVIAFVVINLANFGYLVRRYRGVSRRVEEFVRSADAIAPQAVVLPLLSSHAPANRTFVPVLAHAIDYALVEKQAVDIDDYEAGTGYFPIEFNPAIEAPDFHAIEANPESLNLGAFARASHVFTWYVPDDAPVTKQLALYYDRVSDRGAGRVYRSKLLAALRNGERILLPFAGTTHDRHAADGSLWRVEQNVRNGGARRVHLLISGCELPPVEFDLDPGASAPLAIDKYSIFAVCDRRDADQLQFTTVLRRLDPHGADVALPVPAIRERDFRQQPLVIPDVPLALPTHSTLRVWTSGAVTDGVIVSAGSARKRFSIDPCGSLTVPDLAHELGLQSARATITISAGDASLWGFVSSSDPRAPAPAMLYPR